MKICLAKNFGVDLQEIDDEELFDVDSPPGSVLSANAAPYHPHSHYYDPVEIAIYNDGVPCMTLISEADRCKILHGIPDEAIDEGCFPLDATDAAELEAAEEFVMEMADLALLEEREDQARQSFNHIKKRWEARRQAGPTGRPRPCMNLIIASEHEVKTPMTASSSSSNSLIQYALAQHMNLEDKRMRAREILQSRRDCMEPRRSKVTIASQNVRRPIQQPRKDS